MTTIRDERTYKSPFRIVMLHDPLVAFELRSGSADQSLVALVEAQHDDSQAQATFRRFENAAQGGSPFAMCVCHRMAQAGWGTTKSDQAAFQWASKAAESSYPPALEILGRCFERGIGIATDVKKALKLYETASDCGYGFASVAVGLGLHMGTFGLIEVERAIEFLKRGDAQGESLAGLTLAEWYEYGDKVQQDAAEAVKWYGSSSKLGNFLATMRLQRAFASGELGLQKNPGRADELEKLYSAQV